MSGIGAIIERAPAAVDVVRWLGVAFLIWYGLSSLGVGSAGGSLDAGSGAGHLVQGRRASRVGVDLAHPHVYLDTVLLLGALANQPGPSGR